MFLLLHSQLISGLALFVVIDCKISDFHLFSKMMTNIINNSSLQSEEAFDFLFKIVLIGDCGTGKTCVVQRFRSGTYIERQGSTIGVDFSMKTIFLDGKKIKVITPFIFSLHPFHALYGFR